MTAPVIQIRGVPHYTIRVVARLLRTTPERVRALMGDGTLEWNQARVNGPIVSQPLTAAANAAASWRCATNSAMRSRWCSTTDAS